MSMSRGMARKRTTVGMVAGTVVAVAVAGLTAVSAHAAAGCSVAYSVSSSWPGGFGADVTVSNLGDGLGSWRLTWSFAAGQTITQLWNGSYTQSGAQVTVTNAGYNGTIATGGNVSFGFNGSWTGTNPAPTSFALNGVSCAGPTSNPPTSAVPVTSRPPVTTGPPVTSAPVTSAPPVT